MSTLRKSEISTEFIALVGFIIIVFMCFMIVVGLKNQSISDELFFTDAQRVSDTLANEINFASSIDGYYRDFRLPTALVNSVEYNITIDTNFRLIEVHWGGYSVFSNIITGNVSGVAKPGANKIRNQAGVIMIES